MNQEKKDRLFAELLEKHSLEKGDIIDLGYHSIKKDLSQNDQKIISDVSTDLAHKKYMHVTRMYFDLINEGHKQFMEEENEVKVPPDSYNDYLLNHQEKPTPQQMAWVLSHLVDSFTSGKSSSRILQDAYGFPNKSTHSLRGVLQHVNNALQCCRNSTEAMDAFEKTNL